MSAGLGKKHRIDAGLDILNHMVQCITHRVGICKRESSAALRSATRSRPIAGARSECGILASMSKFLSRERRWGLGAIAAALVISLAALSLRPMVEQRVRARIESAAVRHGA